MALIAVWFSFIFTVTFCNSVSESLWMSEGLYEEVVPAKLQKLIDQGEKRLKLEEAFRTQIFALAFNFTQKLDNFIRDSNEKDILQACEVPDDENVITTVIGAKGLHKKSRFIRKGFYAAFKCKQPGAFQLVGPQSVQCLEKNDIQPSSIYCQPFKNETDWKEVMSQLTSQAKCCNQTALSTGQKHQNPFNCQYNLYCNATLTRSQCSYPNIFDEHSQQCNKTSNELNIQQCNSDKKPTIVVDSANSTWDTMGWLLVEKGSKVILDCIYPNFTYNSPISEYLDAQDLQNMSGPSLIWVKMKEGRNEEDVLPGEWISDYRFRVALNNFDEDNAGVYYCTGVVYSLNHSITIALKEKGCTETALPDFQLHSNYYNKYPFMNHVKRRCQNLAANTRKKEFSDGVRSVEISFN